MANQIRIRTSVEIVQDNDVTVEGIAYSHKSLDGNSDSRTWGGSYNISTEPADDKICYWKNAVIDSAGIDYLNDSAWTEAADVTDGGIPTTAHVVAVEYVNTLGTVATVDVTLAGEVIARLTLGESIVIPWHAGEATSSIGLTASAYSNGVHEATVNVMLAGV
tara:strand:+ start:24 stop:512 length:489 start_codon:yes stop_codon:yes gene_type:complete